MKMQAIRKKIVLCLSCMREHEVSTIRIPRTLKCKDTPVKYMAEYEYCDVTGDLYMTPEQIKENERAYKDAFRRKQGLLTTEEIREIRMVYGISQSDLAKVLGWGEKTVTRYESSQIQDRAHDAVLKKISEDPEWFLTLLKESKEKLSQEAFMKCKSRACRRYREMQSRYYQRAADAELAEELY